MRPFITLSLVLALAPGAPLAAQFVQPLPQAGVSTDADALAEQVRALATNPSDLNALVRAGELALKLDDPTAAAAFFARADRIDPRNPRVKAGTGVLLVQQERPGEALRRFDEAERYGGRPVTFAADRGLAYDLVGEQERAQRDYRLALKAGANDETTRRYALSLGISGKREEALALLDPLLRKSDRGAWRARAFILAMNGDHTDADKIATTMMPAGLSQGLQPFFDRLATLSPVDRAFAVHFGETRASQQRLADARQVPALPPLGVDPDARELAAAAAARTKPARVEVAKVEKPAKRKRGQREPVQLAMQSAAPPVAMALPTPPAYVDPTAAARSTATPGTSGYFVQQLPPRRAPMPAYTQATSVDRPVTPPAYGPVAQANRAAAAAAAPVVQTQGMPAYQPVQRVSGRVMPLAPLQPAPLPGALAAQVRASAPSLVGGSFPARTANPVPTTPTQAFPSSTLPATPVGSASRVEPAPQAAATLPVRPPIETSTVVAPSTAPATIAPATTVETRAETVPLAAATTTVVAPTPTPTPMTITAVPLPASQPAATPAPIRAAPTVSRPVETVEEPRSKPVATVELKRAAEAKISRKPESEPVETTKPVTARSRAAARAAQEAKPTVDPETAEADTGRPLSRRAAAAKKSADAAAEAETGKPLSRKAAAVKKAADAADAEAAVAANKPLSRKAAAAKKAAEAAEADAADSKGETKGSSRKGAASKKTVDTDDAPTDAKTARGKKRADRTADADASDGKASARKGARKGADTADSAEDDKPMRGKKGSDARKSADEDKADSKKKPSKSAEPSRVWVQVSGGANENDLPKQWNKLRADKPEMFKGRAGYSTPLRATNRILTGPFASEAEAQAYVNKLAGKGMSGFLFKSEPGQKINKLPAK